MFIQKKVFGARCHREENVSSRDEFLKILEECRGEFISGADAARRLGISGTAVWKAARKLKSEGYMIESVTNKGYRLRDDSDVLSYDSVSRHLDPSVSDVLTVDVFTSTDSTNNVCKNKAAEGAPEGYVAVSANQTAGRGRRGRSFYSPSGTGLYLSILLRPEGLSARESLMFTTMAAVAVCEAIEAVSGKETGIKWVNDIFMDDRKVCGILTEASFDLESGTLDYAVVGIGINVFTPEGGFPEEIRDTAGAIYSEREASGYSLSDIRGRLAAAVISRFMGYYLEAKKKNAAIGDLPAHISEYRKRCIVIGKDINVLMPGADPAPAHVLDIDDECGLIVRYPDGNQEVLRSGEISIRLSK